MLYCVRCRRKTETNDLRRVISKNNRHMLYGKCAVCGLTKTQFVKSDASKTGGDLVSTLNSVTKNITLPWGNVFPGELHLPGLNFAGPGTRLDKRLTSTGAWKEWSKPVDRIDNAAYHHDLAYQHFPDTATRNIADRLMLDEMDAIKDPTMRERIERAIIKPIINAKQKFGLGVTGLGNPSSKNSKRPKKSRIKK